MRTIRTERQADAPGAVESRELLRRLVVGSAVVVAIDQASKLLASPLDHGALGAWIEPGLNRGYSLGLVTASGGWLILGTLVALLAGGTWVAVQVRADRVPVWAAAAVLGGGLSNLIDRMARGGVLDFVVTPWVVLNVADLAVVAGICTISARSLRSRSAHPSASPASSHRPGERG